MRRQRQRRGKVGRVVWSVRVLAGSSVGLIQRLMSYFEYESCQSAEFQTGAYRAKKGTRTFFLVVILVVAVAVRGVNKHTPLGRLPFVRACPSPFVHNLWHFIVSHLLMSLLKKLKKKKN